MKSGSKIRGWCGVVLGDWICRYKDKAVAATALLAVCCGASAQSVVTPPLQIHSPEGDSTVPVQLQPSAIVPVPGAKPGISSVSVVGGVDQAGIYLVRVRMEPGATNAAHVHPDARVTTVLSGTIYYGIGPKADRAHGQAFGPGSVYFTPAHVPHWLIAANDGPAVYEEVGFGPSVSTPVGASGP